MNKKNVSNELAVSELREKIKQSIIAQLMEKDRIKYAHYEDLVNDYMKLWDFKNALQVDIEERGVSVYWQNSETQYGYKKNDSISELLKVNKQMLTILYDLGIRAADVKAVEPDDEL